MVVIGLRVPRLTVKVLVEGLRLLSGRCLVRRCVPRVVADVRGNWDLGVIVDLLDDRAVGWRRWAPAQVDKATAAPHRRVVGYLLLLSHRTPCADLTVRCRRQVLGARQDRQTPKSQPHPVSSFVANDPRKSAPVVWVFWPSVCRVLLVVEEHP